MVLTFKVLLLTIVALVDAGTPCVGDECEKPQDETSLLQHALQVDAGRNREKADEKEELGVTGCPEGYLKAMMTRMHTGKGFIAALDQSGGSTPKALNSYGVQTKKFSKHGKIDNTLMFQKVHEMRTRIMTDKAFDHRIVGSILFEKTMLDEVDGKGSALYLWSKNVVPFLKVDQGLEEKNEDNVRLMNDLTQLDAKLTSAVDHCMFGTKMRSVIEEGATEAGIKDIVKQQFEIAEIILAKGLTPIIEPEVNIKAKDKATIEGLLERELMKAAKAVSGPVIYKLTLPEQDNLYEKLIHHEKTVRVVALSGGYSKDEACARLKKQNGMIASFSRAFAQGLQKKQSKNEFTATLNANTADIYKASLT